MPIIVVPINPVPASRPKIRILNKPIKSKSGGLMRTTSYYGKIYTKFRKEVEKVIPALFKSRRDFPVKGFVEVSILFLVKKPKTSKLIYPGSDIDNFQKALLDAVNTYAWEDDRKIVKITAEKAWTQKKGLTILKVRPMESRRSLVQSAIAQIT